MFVCPGTAETAQEDHVHSAGSDSSQGKASVCPGREAGEEWDVEGGGGQSGAGEKEIWLFVYLIISPAMSDLAWVQLELRKHFHAKFQWLYNFYFLSLSGRLGILKFAIIMISYEK